MWTQTRIAPSSSRSAEIASSKSRAVGGSIVNVGSCVRSRRGPASAVRRLLGGGARGALDGGVEAAPQPAVEHQRLEHVARVVGAPEPPRDLAVAAARARRRDEHEVARAHLARRLVEVDAAPAGEERRRGEEPAALLEDGDDRLGAAHACPRATTVLTATSSASSRFVLSLSLRLDVGRDPGALLRPAAAEVAAAGGEVLADRDVERAAVGELLDLLEDALAERAGAHHRRAVAVLQRAGDDLRRRGRLAVDEHGDRDLGVDRGARRLEHVLGPRAAARGDDLALGDEDRRHQDGLVEQAAAVVAEVEDDRLGALADQAAHGLADLAVGARGEAGELDVGDLLVARARHARLDHRDVHVRALEPDLARRGLARDDGQRHRGAGRALDARRGLLGGDAAQRATADGDDLVPGLEAASGGRRALEDRQHAQPARNLLDVHAHALERALRGLVERAVGLRVEVVREAVVERVDGRAERLVEQLLAIDLAVVVLLDDVDRLVVELRVVVADQRVADRARQRAAGGRRARSRPPAARARAARRAARSRGGDGGGAVRGCTRATRYCGRCGVPKR